MKRGAMLSMPSGLQKSILEDPEAAMSMSELNVAYRMSVDEYEAGYKTPRSVQKNAWSGTRSRVQHAWNERVIPSPGAVPLRARPAGELGTSARGAQHRRPGHAHLRWPGR